MVDRVQSDTIVPSTGDGGNEQQRSSISRTLPTRTYKAVAMKSNRTICSGNNAGLESRQDSKVNDNSDVCEGFRGAGTDVTYKGNGEDDERIPTPKDVVCGDEPLGIPLEPVFVLKDMNTIEDPTYDPRESSSQYHLFQRLTSKSPQRHHMRSPSPPPGHGSVISRRGRSRSPVGLTPHHQRSGSNSRAPSTVTVVAGTGGQDELSSAALAAGEAAANNLAASYEFQRHCSPTNIDENRMGAHTLAGRRSPSPVSRFPSLTSQSFEISPQPSMKVDGIMGSFDWNVGPTLQQPQFPKDNFEGCGDGKRSPLSIEAPHTYVHLHQQSGREEQYRELCPSRVGGGKNYSDYQSHHCRRPDENIIVQNSDKNTCESHHPAYHEAQRRSPSPTCRSVVVEHNGETHHRCQVTGDYFHERNQHTRTKNQVNGGGGKYPMRRNSQQALFPEHHILSSHSKDRDAFESAANHSSTSLNRDYKMESTGKSKRAESRGSGQSNNNQTHRSSVFRGSPTERDRGQRQQGTGGGLPQELLLALEEDDDNDVVDKHPGAVADKEPDVLNCSAKSETKKDNFSMTGVVDQMQFDDCLLQEDINLNDYDDYLTCNLSFRKSYDLGQVFSFIKESCGSGAHGELSFNLELSSESNEEGNCEGTNRVNNGSGNHRSSKGGHALCSSQSMGLTPINSFSYDRQGGNNNIVPLNSIDGMALRAFFSSSPNTTGASQLEQSAYHGGGPLSKVCSPRVSSGVCNLAQSENAPVVHASTPPSYSHRGLDMQYGTSQSSQVRNYGTISQYTDHGSSSSIYCGGSLSQSSTQQDMINQRGVISTSFPSKRIKLSSKHTVNPIAMDLSRRCEGDDFGLLRKLASCFEHFRFKLPELRSIETESSSLVAKDEEIKCLVRSPGGLQQGHLLVASRRISSSICAFGGSLPPRVVSPPLSPESRSSLDRKSKTDRTSNETAKAASIFHLQDSEERLTYEKSLSGRYFMKETCISWDVELHDIITPQASNNRRGQKRIGVSDNTVITEKRQIGVFKKEKSHHMISNYCAPVTPSSPSDSPSASSPDPHALLSSGDDSSSPYSRSSQEKGTKIKYRCKLCGQPKQNHTCSYQSAMVRSIGTMVYPAVNAFISNEPGRLAPALSEMNNFTSLLSQDTSATGGNPQSNFHSFGTPHLPTPYPTFTRGPYVGNLIAPDAGDWSPNTPGGLSTMSSIDVASPGCSTENAPGGNGSNSMNARHHGGALRHNPTLLSRSMNRSMSMSLSGPPHPSISHAPSMLPAPAGAIPSDVLFRDTMELKPEQFRTVGATNTSALNDVGCNVASKAIIDSPTAFRYPPIPTPYSLRKELGDTLFAMSREVPNLADSCASILREARENDDWDQAVAELTTQVLIVIKCEEQDYALEGLRRHLLTLGISC